MSKNNNKKEETPLIKQYNNIKSKYPDTILLFQVGDFYETFDKDAILCSKILNIVLTKKSNIKHLAGFPCHSLNTYLPKLIKSGNRVAICNQVEDKPVEGKNIVKRDVVELITPGVIINENILNIKSNNFLSSVHIEKNSFGLSLLDISTGEFFVVEDDIKYVYQYINHFKPSEIIYQNNKKHFFDKLLINDNYPTFLMNDWMFNYQLSYEKMIMHFKTNSLKGFGIDDMKLGIISSGVILYYLYETYNFKIKHISNIRRIKKENCMWIDDSTFKNLEIFHPINKNGSSLINVIDFTITPMGGRLLKNWILFPIIDIDIIKNRINIVKELYENEKIRILIKKNLKSIHDIDRIISRMVMDKTNIRDIIILNESLISIDKMKKITFFHKKVENIKKLIILLQDCNYISKKIEKTINKNVLFTNDKIKHNIIKKGNSKELDKLRDLYLNQKEYLLKLCDKEQSKTGIKNIKIHFNNILGYSFEIRKKYKNIVPSHWKQKQTLSSTIRYSTDELKNYEVNIINNEQKIFYLEKEIIKNLINNILKHIKILQNNSKLIAKIDVLHSFSSSAIENNYSMPIINNSHNLSIIEGRHPVIEKQFLLKNSYIPNDILLNSNKQQIIIITGPNMSGKSAILRQTAIIILMTHIGSFVPAKKVEIGLINKIFSRVGAYDNISMGESTFMVEMNETANILNNISKRSFIILDEIGRGTSTYDGIAIAKSIIEFLHNSKMNPLVLFATHYHELNNMTLFFKRVKNYHVSVKKIKDNIVFIRKLMIGGSDSSLGIYIAKISGMPINVVKKSMKILKKLKNDKKNKCLTKEKNYIFLIKKIIHILNNIKNIELLSNKDAIIKINEIQKLLN
ncbi:DNA mismatch repair protein MutS [Blattabacterium cuenoti]|uniref:DNA mismatch repair protein MutS n=1 Tax=Blattabacterium cuenoti TaxID=1653831 RepID=UPI00163CBD2F|nr:DNA mismatch repair protein MutS [Blattabacterium cuenoti]